jgi:FdrA protein
MANRFDDLLRKGPVPINVGVEEFVESLQIQGLEVVHVRWTPPAGGDETLIELLDKLL